MSEFLRLLEELVYLIGPYDKLVWTYHHRLDDGSKECWVLELDGYNPTAGRKGEEALRRMVEQVSSSKALPQPSTTEEPQQ